MRSSFTLFPLFLAAVQAMPDALFPTVAILPIQGVADVTSGNGFNSIANSLLVNAQSVSLQANSIDAANANLNVNASAGAGAGASIPSVDIARILQNVTNTFWQESVDVEMKVCSLVLSINQQNLATQQANLIAGLNAQANATLRLAAVIQATISNVQNELTTFTNSETAILAAAIAAVVASSQASVVPVANLINGLKAIGFGGLTDALSSVQGSVAALASTAAQVNFGLSH